MITPRLVPVQFGSAFDGVLQGVASGLADLIPAIGLPQPISTDQEPAVPLPRQYHADTVEDLKI
ncbi:MAG: hypothetical protein K2Y56_26150 [Methylobacterium sp.]|uniref:hypothetical protein n=1 Tax=Methylobacterium sp. TaxID=409 RepID=UPI0025F6DB6E|nr:hypothetical protein [Methylobacterium sp.]MBX9934947.1 hypothetical protein [Methylobacterium sp.]